MRIPADSILIQSSAITVDESELTGESDDLERRVITRDNHKDGESSVLLARSNVKTGEGWAVVVAVGSNTFAGDIGTSVSDDEEMTPL